MPESISSPSECAECIRLREINAELLDSLDLLLCLISVNGPDVGILSDPYTIQAIHKARAAVAKATGEKLA